MLVAAEEYGVALQPVAPARSICAKEMASRCPDLEDRQVLLESLGLMEHFNRGQALLLFGDACRGNAPAILCQSWPFGEFSMPLGSVTASIFHRCEDSDAEPMLFLVRPAWLFSLTVAFGTVVLNTAPALPSRIQSTG